MNNILTNFMTGFSKACPSGNHMVMDEEPNITYIETLTDLRAYIRGHLPTFDRTEIKWMLKDFKKQGYLEV